MTIRIRLALFISAALVIMLLLAIYAFNLHNRLHDELDEIRTDSSHFLLLTNQIDNNFQKQLLSWSNLLLRGLNPDQYHRYLQDFYQQERDTRQFIKRLTGVLTHYPEALEQINNFNKSHRVLGIRFRKALKIYNDSENPIYETDQYIWNSVDNPLTLLHKINEIILKHRETLLIQSSLKHEQAESFLISVGLIFVIAMITLFIVLIDKTVGKPLSRTINVARQISNGDFTQRVTDKMPGEFSLFSHAFNQMMDKITQSNDDLKKNMQQLEDEITRRSDLEQELELKKHVAEESSRAKSEFLSNVSHEIRTPLNVVSGYAELLAMTATSDTQKKYIKSIQSGSSSLLNIINDVLDLAKIESGKLTIETSTFDLHELLNEIRHMFIKSSQEKGLNFQLDISQNTPRHITLDKNRLKQILLNLLSNAIKFTRQGEVILTVDSSPTTNPDRSNLILSVKDSGIGIPEEYQHTIFNHFEQIDSQDSRKYGGTGLGLAISQKLAHMLNGNITVSSTPGKGSVFLLMLHEVPTDRPTSGSQLTHEVPIKRLNPAKILIADDIQANRKLIMDFLDGQPIEFIEADNGKKSIEAARLHKPDLVLMDIKMPEMDGIEATKIMKSDDQLKNIPVIAVTASSTRSNDEHLKDSLFDDYLSKPINLTLLTSVLSQHLAN